MFSTRLNFVSDPGSSDQAPQQPPRPRPQPSDADLLDAYSQAVVGVVEGVSPAVISVHGEGRRSGSSFVITPDGYAVTNSHVVGGRDKLIATTTEGDRVDAQVIGDDPATDLALLRLAASDLPHATMGDSAALRVGQLVIAMGSPLGLHSTVSTGIVSALDRSLRGQDGRLIDSVVQHTAPINPGNSGGPLVDSRGRVVGVNTAIVAMAQGLGFAVPSNTAEWITSEILTHGRVRRRQLGIAAAPDRLPRQVVLALDLLSDQVVRVIEVARGSIAARHGIEEGDAIVSINGRMTPSVDDVHRLLTLIPQETPLEISIVRGSELLEIAIES